MLSRRHFLTTLGATSAQAYAAATRGLPPLKITNVKVILTNPPVTSAAPVSSMGRLVIAKVETSEPGLYGLGCASFVFRPGAVASVIENQLKPFVIGRDPEMVEDLYKAMNVSALWRTGPVENYAVSGIDMALWDIKAKRANMPLYQLLGGKTRSAVQVYGDAGGRDGAEMAESVQKAVEKGYRHVRLNYAEATLPPSPAVEGMPAPHPVAPGAAPRFGPTVIDPDAWSREIPRIWEHVRQKCGDKVELMQHLHGELPPVITIGIAKRLEPYRPYFFEDPFFPEDVGYMKNLRQQTTVPIAIGEKFVSDHEYVGLVTERLIDFIRVHIPAIGGLTKARKLTTLCEWYAVRTAWHAPGDLSPVGHAANAHLDLASPNFGIQEGSVIHGDEIREVFPGTPVIKKGFLYVNEAPGLGIDINEKVAAKYPCSLEGGNFGPKRSVNGSIIGN
ncbi:MAG TPA: enolase C-terminal domain-like protein [Bryobacteraceae bacterium]|nr:enolase C-terminal domain-like protein [Bryobacteraceae bacterium]